MADGSVDSPQKRQLKRCEHCSCVPTKHLACRPKSVLPADLKDLSTKLDVKDDKIKDWPQDLTVYAEHPSYFYDMMTKPMLAQACAWLTQLTFFLDAKPYATCLHSIHLYLFASLLPLDVCPPMIHGSHKTSGKFSVVSST